MELRPLLRRNSLRDNGLSVTFGTLFLSALVAQAVAGRADFNNQQLANGGKPATFLDYLVSADFAVDVTENWQSEYLQFFLYTFLTVWLLQKGSPESKSLDDPGRESDRKQKVGRYAEEDSPAWARARGWKLTVYSNSLGLVMGHVIGMLISARANPVAFERGIVAVLCAAATATIAAGTSTLVS